MCNKLLQLFACGHAKTICVTPCPHAVATGEQITAPESRPALLHSNPTVTSTAPHISDAHIHNLESQQNHTPTATHTQDGQYRLVPPLQHSASSSPSPPAHTTSSTQASPGPSAKDPSPLVATLSRPVSTIPPLYACPSVLPAAAFKADPEPLWPRPNYCPYTFPHYLPQSRHPCLLCFVIGKEWQSEREKLVSAYRQEHHGVRGEDLERLCGLEGLRDRFKEEEGGAKRGG